MTTMTRTDEHSPTNMDPQAYEYVAAFDNGTPGFLVNVDMEWWRSITNWPSETADRGTHQCHHCGARIRYFAIMKHLPTGKHIAVGETCLDNRFSLASKADFDRLRKAAALDRQKQRIKTMAADFVDAIEDAEIRNALDRNTDLDDLLAPHDYAIRTVGDIRRKLWDIYGDLSDKQVAFVGRLITEANQRRAEQAQREANPETYADAPRGRVAVEGLVISRKWKDSDYGGAYKITLKMTEADGSVWLGWVTEPSSIECERGDMVALTAAWTPSSDKPYFAFGKRPSKARITQEKAVAVEDLPSALDE